VAADLGLDGLAASIVNPPGAEAYLIVTYSWLLLYKRYPDELARALTSFLLFALDEGQNYAVDLEYISLPRPVVELGKTAVAQINSDASSAAPAHCSRQRACPSRQGNHIGDRGPSPRADDDAGARAGVS